jgi:excisionase family DNA binding protein
MFYQNTLSSLLSPQHKASSDLLTRREAAEYLGVTENTLAVWASVKRYNLSYVKVGRLVKYRRADLDAFIERRTITQQDV